jgi:trans-aconitate methyltransferase
MARRVQVRLKPDTTYDSQMATQQWDPDTYARNARFVSDLGAGVVDLLAPQTGERILDLGCGDGALTETLVAAGCCVVAIDGSAAQVAAACTRGLDASVAHAEALPFAAEFDAVFSNSCTIRLGDGWQITRDSVSRRTSRAEPRSLIVQETQWDTGSNMR